MALDAFPLSEKGIYKAPSSISTWCGTTLWQPQQPRNGLNVNDLMFLNLVTSVFYTKPKISWEQIFTTDQ